MLSSSFNLGQNDPMIEIEIPGTGHIRLKYLVLDVNGTLALDGRILDGVPERLETLGETLDVHILTADAYGTLSKIDIELGIISTRISPNAEAQQKADYIHQLGAMNSVAIGNGANDSLMLESAQLGIIVIGHEGAAMKSLQKADIVCTDIFDALDLLRQPQRIAATLRK